MAARIGYAIQNAIGLNELARELGCSNRLARYITIGRASHVQALRAGRIAGVDVPAMVNEMVRDPRAHAIPVKRATKRWSEWTSCRDMWKLDTLCAYLYNIVAPYNGGMFVHQGVAQYPRLSELCRAASQRAGYVIRDDSAFRDATLTFRAMTVIAEMCRYPLPRADAYTTFVYDPNADRWRAGPGFGGRQDRT
jgi:hypothetical protein